MWKAMGNILLTKKSLMAIFRIERDEIAATCIIDWWIPEEMNRHFFPIGTKTAVQTNALPNLVLAA